MAEPLSADEIRRIAADPDTLRARAFEILQSVAALVPVSAPEAEDPRDDDGVARDLVIRLHENREALGPYESILDSLTHRLGLFPYIDEDTLNERELLELEWNRPEGEAVEDYVFHSAQGQVYRALLEGENVVLSAPTSFGKSLLIDAAIATARFANVAIIVPTIALLDETRRRLSRFAPNYKIVTHVSQRPADRNIFVMTQERLLEYPDLPKIDFFVIDEFYKLDLRQDPDRAALLNQAFYRLWKTEAQFYLLGPNVENIAPDVPWKARYIRTDFRTVAVDTKRVQRTPNEEDVLVGICGSLDEPTIIYCKSPARTRVVAEWLLEAGVGPHNPDLHDAVEWIGHNFHSEWLVARALARGIGIHHGRLPRALAHLIIRLFNEGRLRFLLCTSTLIEGVNTAAKNVIVLDNKVANKNFDFFTYNNIKGRVGRMMRHFVGRVFLFYDAPDEQLPIVDMPVFTQTPATPLHLLLALDESERTEQSNRRLAPYLENDLLSVDVMRANTGIDLDDQLATAQLLANNPVHWSRLLAWSGIPTWEQLEATCSVIWDELGGGTHARVQAIRSARQLAFYLRRLSDLRGDSRAMIERELDKRSPDDAVESVLEFTRSWPGHHFPRYLAALQRIEEEVFGRRGLPSGSYKFYASSVERLFMPPFTAALEEYGIPAEVTRRVPSLLVGAESLDDVIERLRELPTSQLPLTGFERELVADAQSSL